ncbi:MAG: HIT family protein [Acidimicrobiales bacterium]
MGLDRLWAGWRTEYVSSADDSASGDPTEAGGCVFCRILSSSDRGADTGVLWRGTHAAAVLNAYPYTSGHLMVMPVRHTADLETLSVYEGSDLWSGITAGITAIKSAYGPDGINVGANLGRAAGAGVPGHAHMHVLPRWEGDTNFTTAVAGVRVMPESLPATFDKLSAAWPTPSV